MSPNTKVAGMSCSANGTKEVASDVQYSLGSDWYDVPTVASTFSVHDVNRHDLAAIWVAFFSGLSSREES